MDSVIMTTPGNSMRLRSRLRSAANTICARSARNRVGITNRNHHHNHNHNHANGVLRSAGRNVCQRNPHYATKTALNNINNRNIVDNLIVNNHRCVAASNNNGNEIKPSGHVSFIHVGAITREVYNVWCGRLGDVTRIPSDSVQALFNDMQLYPSKSQVVEMLQCARQCGRRNSSQFLTFGEFCVFAGELRRRGRGRQPHHHNQVQKSSKTLSYCEVFLGGSCNPTTWRADFAIPTLSKYGISFYNPQVSTWGPELMAAEHEAKESAAVLFFVVDSQTRCVAGMLEVAHLVAKQRVLVLVVHPFVSGQAIMGETISPQEFVDLSEGQSTLLTLVKNQGVAVHSNLTKALQCTVNILRGPEAAQDSIADRKLTDKLIKLREVFDSVDLNRTGELSLSDVSFAYYQLTGSHLRISDLRAIMDISEHGAVNPDDVHISFEQFCGVVAEFTTSEGCNTTANSTTSTRLSDANTTDTDEWVNQPLQRQSSTNNNSNFEYTLLNGQKNHQNGDSHYDQYDLYLGGSCIKRTTWRQNVAIPLLKKYGVTYYNPSLHENISAQQTATNLHNAYVNGDMNDNSSVEIVRSASRDLLHDMDVMNHSKIVLFVITNETRSITSMILAAHYIAQRKNVVLCVQQLPLDGCVIGSDMLTKQAVKDYNRARAYLSDLAKHENVPIFETVKEAVQCAINLVQTQRR